MQVEMLQGQVYIYFVFELSPMVRPLLLHVIFTDKDRARDINL